MKGVVSEVDDSVQEAEICPAQTAKTRKKMSVGVMMDCQSRRKKGVLNMYQLETVFAVKISFPFFAILWQIVPSQRKYLAAAYTESGSRECTRVEDLTSLVCDKLFLLVDPGRKATAPGKQCSLIAYFLNVCNVLEVKSGQA